MHRIAFPRLYVPPPETPELPPKAPEPPRFPLTYHGKRSEFGPVTVYSMEETREVVSDKECRGEEAVHLARDLFRDLALSHDQEQDEAFAREVLAKLPADGWELSAADIRKWHRRWCAREEEARWNYPPAFDAYEELPGPEDEARMLELVKRLGRES